MNWRELLAETAGVVGERPAARWLCEVASGADRVEDVLDEPATERMVAHLDTMVARYQCGEPLAYVLGRWSFRNLDLAVDRRVLIPRPETEVVAGVAIELVRAQQPPIVVADLGTGSGAIGLAMADELPVDGVTVWLTDSSPDAIDVARANLAGIGRRAANVRIAEGRWFEALPEGTLLDVAVANPPYIADDAPDVDEAVRAWEPHEALFAGPDGLREIRAIVDAAPPHLRPGGWLVLEIGATQGPAVERLLLDADYAEVSIRPDLAAPRPRRRWQGHVVTRVVRWASPRDQPKRTAISESSVPSSGVTSSSAPTSSRAAENSARRRTRLVMRASIESSSPVTVSWAHAPRAVATAWPRYWSTEKAVPRQSSVSSFNTPSSSSPMWWSASITTASSSSAAMCSRSAVAWTATPW